MAPKIAPSWVQLSVPFSVPLEFNRKLKIAPKIAPKTAPKFNFKRMPISTMVGWVRCNRNVGIIVELFLDLVKPFLHSLVPCQGK